MSNILEQINEVQSNIREIKSTWGQTIMTLDNIKSSLKADRQKAIDEAYQKGFEAGQHEATTLEYEQGLDDAWKALLRITGLNNTVRNNIFGMAGIDNILVMYTAQEAIAKICEHEEQQKADAEIKVGDEVCFVFAGGETIEPFIVFSIKDDNGKKYYEGIQTSDGRWVSGGLKYYKTGRHFPQVAELFKAMKGEQRNCSTCKHDNDGLGKICRRCAGYEKWEPKEGAE